MTKEEGIILSAYTGYLLVEDFGDVHQFIEKLLDRPVWTHQLADPAIVEEIRTKCKPLIPIGREEDRWIPVTEKLPKNDYGKHWKERAYYLVRLSNGTMRVAHYGYKEYDWWIDSHDCVLSKKHYTEVTHWRQLPEQPKEGV